MTNTQKELTNEIWRFIPGLHGRYSISNLGNVRKNAYYRAATSFIGAGTVHPKSVPVKDGKFSATNVKSGKRKPYLLSAVMNEVWGSDEYEAK